MFRRSSRCEATNCVEVDTEWSRSAHCAAEYCVEVSLGGFAVAVRDSKEDEGAPLVFEPAAWQSAMDALKEAA